MTTYLERQKRHVVIRSNKSATERKFVAENHHFDTPEKAKEFVECYLRQAELDNRHISVLSQDECWVLGD